MEPLLILASQSPARASLLERAHVPFDVVVSHVDEDAALAAHGPLSPADTALLLARAKAEAVADLDVAAGRLVLGCDSVFELDGASHGKPHRPEVAVERITAMSGRTGTLHTGHWLVDRRDDVGRDHGELDRGANRRDGVIPANGDRQSDGEPGNHMAGAGAVSSADVHFARMSPEEIRDYVASGEPLEVAGSFTLDGRGAVFIDRVEGDPNAVIGLSVATLRRLLAERGVSLSRCWRAQPERP